MAEEKKVEKSIPDTLPEGFVSVKPHVNAENYQYTLHLKDGDSYAVTSGAKRPVELFDRIFCDPGMAGAIPRKVLPSPSGEPFVFFVFPEAVVKLDQEILTAIEAGWPEEDE